MLTIATCQTYPNPPQNLLPLASLLEKQGIPAHFAPWQSKPDTPLLLPLCAWDYAAAPQQFADWLAHAEAQGQRFANPPELMRWNMNKQYLCDLAAWGAAVIPSIFLPSEKEVVRQTLQAKGWHEAVIKPAVGQSGKGVRRVSGGILSDLSAYPQGIIAQPYIREIESAGEMSLVYFNGIFSHAVRRQPPQGEWRANSAYNVEISSVMPPDSARAAAETALHLLPQMPLYARIDGTLTAQGFLLNELELIEPALYLNTDSGADARLVKALADLCANGGNAV